MYVLTHRKCSFCIWESSLLHKQGAKTDKQKRQRNTNCPGAPAGRHHSGPGDPRGRRGFLTEATCHNFNATVLGTGTFVKNVIWVEFSPKLRNFWNSAFTGHITSYRKKILWGIIHFSTRGQILGHFSMLKNFKILKDVCYLTNRLFWFRYRTFPNPHGNFKS